MQNKICIIGVYFGSLPNYISLWIKSCEYNPTVDFYVFTDQEAPAVPQNVYWKSMTLPEMKRRAEDVLGFPVRLESPYKCCDYKVIYGLIFKDYVSKYDFWGHCDFDLIFGDLQSFFDKFDLYAYDRFLSLGHLSLYRNTEEVNKRYACGGSAVDFNQVYTTDDSCVFDELPGMTAIYQQNGFPMFSDRVFVDIASVYHRYRVIDEYPLDKKPINYAHQIFYFERGKTYRAYFVTGTLQVEEYIYIHFKKRPNYEVPFAPCDAEAFYITNQGFVKKSGKVTLELIKKLNPYRGKVFESYEKIKFQIKTKFRNAKRKLQRLRE